VAKQTASKSKSKTGRMPQICLSLPADALAVIDKQAELNGRTRAGQVRFFLIQESARQSTAKVN